MVNKETDRREQPWAREERSAATKGAGIGTAVVRAMAAKVGSSAWRSGKRSGSKSVRSARASGSKSVRSANESAETAPAVTVPGEAEPGRPTRRPARDTRPGAFGLFRSRTVSSGMGA